MHTIQKVVATVFLLIISHTSAVAQMPDSAQNAFITYGRIPNFSLIKVADSTVFTNANLKPNTKTIIMAFSPDCEHCQAMTKELVAHQKKLKNFQIVMSSPLPFYYLKDFYNNYGLAQCPNITLCRDVPYFFGSFYKIKSFPRFYLYNKKGQLYNWHSGEVPIKKLLQ
jgi:thioredoxin-related protein